MSDTPITTRNKMLASEFRPDELVVAEHVAEHIERELAAATNDAHNYKEGFLIHSKRADELKLALITRTRERDEALEQLESAHHAIRSAAARFEQVNFGWDGDCGSKNIIETLEGILPEK